MSGWEAGLAVMLGIGGPIALIVLAVGVAVRIANGKEEE